MISQGKNKKSQGALSRRAFVGLTAAAGVAAGFLVGWLIKPPEVADVARTITQTVAQTTTETEAGAPGTAVTKTETATVTTTEPAGPGATATPTKLPSPSLTGTMSAEEAMFKRRSIRDYIDKPLTLNQLSQLLWAAQGITESRWGFRTAPSAGATYPLEVYVVVGEDGVTELGAGAYRYNPKDHSLGLLVTGDHRHELTAASLGQRWVAEAPLNIVIAAVYERTTAWYGERGVRYVHMEVGHAGENIYLQATALGLGTVVIGAFHEAEVGNILRLPADSKPLYVIPVGYPK